MINLIAKANNDVISWCRCSSALAGLPGQLGCPWCGCGWLLNCTTCDKSFTYGRIVRVEYSYADFVRADMRSKGYEATDIDIKSDADLYHEMLSDFRHGDEVIYFDGCFFRVEETDVKFEGLFANHQFSQLPHFEAKLNPSILRTILGDKKYWIDREHPSSLRPAFG